MKYEQLRTRVCMANKRISREKLAILTWGNVSEADRSAGVFAIKPSGLGYDMLAPEHIVVLSLEDGRVLEGDLNPSSDTPTHLELYSSFSSICGVAHSHSKHATAWAQAECPIPCLGTTHCDHFFGAVPCTRPLSAEEIRCDYEHNTGRVIVEHFNLECIDPLEMPGVIVARHAPFTWGRDADAAVENALVLEEVADIAMLTLAIDNSATDVDEVLLNKHFSRKHGSKAYYGQAHKKEKT